MLLGCVMKGLVSRILSSAALLPLPLVAALVLVTSAAQLNQSYLVPGGKIHIDRAALKGEAGRVCALTFDDGPEAGYTAKLCAILDQYQIKATFFCVGRNVVAYPKAMKQLVASGHEIGNHTYSHPVSTQLSIAKLKQQLQKTNAALEKYGVTPRWFRPPYGEISAADVKAASSLGFATVLWSVDPRDWAQPGVDTIVSRVLKGATPGAVILLHCTHAQTVSALPRIIEGLRDKGYTFVTMTQWEQVVTGQATLPLPAVKPLEIPAAPAEVQPAAKALEASASPPGSSTEPPADAMSPGFYQVFGESVPEAAGAADAEPGAPLGAEAAPESATESAPQLLPAAASSEALNVYSNFLGAGDLTDIFRTGKTEHLQQVAFGAADLGSPNGSAEMAVTDEAVAVAERLPTLPKGEEIVSLLSPALPVAATPAQPLATPEQPQPVPPRIVDLADFSSEAMAWAPPATIDSSSFLNTARESSPDGLYPPASFYYLCMADDLEQATWTELDSYVRLAKLSGLVLPSGLGIAPPACEMSCPGAYVRLDSIDRNARVDLAAKSVADVIDMLKRQKQNVFIVLQPSNLRLFSAARSWSGMSDNLRDFVLFRQMTAGLSYDPAPALDESWKLPAGVQLGRFTDGRRVVLILCSQGSSLREVAVPPDFAYLSRAFIDASGSLNLAPLDGASVFVGESPMVLYWVAPQ